MNEIAQSTTTLLILTSSTTVINAGCDTFFGLSFGALSARFLFSDWFDILSYLLRLDELEAR